MFDAVLQQWQREYRAVEVEGDGGVIGDDVGGVVSGCHGEHNDHGWGGGGDWRNGSSEWKWMQNNGGSERENEREIKTLWPYMGPRLRCQDA